MFSKRVIVAISIPLIIIMLGSIVYFLADEPGGQVVGMLMMVIGMSSGYALLMFLMIRRKMMREL